jgi:hypothetical protein
MNDEVRRNLFDVLQAAEERELMRPFWILYRKATALLVLETS